MFLTGLLVGVLLGIAVVMPVLSWCERERRRHKRDAAFNELLLKGSRRETDLLKRQLDRMTESKTRTMWD